MTIAVCPGSFDPLTVGHVDVIQRAASLFDQVVVGIAVNSSKRTLLSLEDRLSSAREVFTQNGAANRIRVEPVPGLLVDFCREIGASALVKGLRGGADFDAELPMALMNRHLVGVETVFIVGDSGLAHVASSLVKDVGRFGGQIEDLVPPTVVNRVHEALALEAARAEQEKP